MKNNLKIKSEDFLYVKEEIAKAIEKFPEMKGQYEDLGRSHERYCWDLLWLAGLSDFLVDVLYLYLNDSHVDSALKNIVQEIEQDQE